MQVVIFLLIFSSSLRAGEISSPFFKWLNRNDSVFAKEITEKASEKFRERYGYFTTRFTDSSKTEWTPEFLSIAERVFKERTGRTIDEFCELTNSQMKVGISPSVSRFREETREFSDVFSQYLDTNLKLLKSGKDLSTSEANKENWKQHVRVAAMESIGGNAGAGAVAVNFLADKQGRIVFVGNIQDAIEDIKQQYHKGRLADGTVRYAVDSSIYQLFTNARLAPEARERLTQDFTEINRASPQPSYETFDRNCKLALKKLLGR